MLTFGQKTSWCVSWAAEAGAAGVDRVLSRLPSAAAAAAAAAAGSLGVGAERKGFLGGGSAGSLGGSEAGCLCGSAAGSLGVGAERKGFLGGGSAGSLGGSGTGRLLGVRTLGGPDPPLATGCAACALGDS